MANTFAGTTRVFVGNLSYAATEEALFEAFRTVGPVVGARLVFDKETGKMKGFGFVEFNDYETAQSAVRNLNGYLIDGRGIRVDMAEPEKRKGGVQPPLNQPPLNKAGPPPGQLPPNLPTGMPLAPGMSATDSITQTLATLPPEQLLDILSQMKSLVTTSPEQARTLLNAHPQLSYALFQAMVLMKVVDPAILQRMLAPSLGAPQPQQQPSFVGGVGSYQQPQPSYYDQSAVPPPMQNTSPAYPPSFPQQQQPQQPAPVPGAPAMDQATQAALLQQVLSMSQAQIDALPPKDRETVMALKAQIAGMTR